LNTQQNEYLHDRKFSAASAARGLPPGSGNNSNPELTKHNPEVPSNSDIHCHTAVRGY
jgi:hypothetical protein